MTALLSSLPVVRGPADRCCDRPPCFEARLEAAAGRRQVRRHTWLCAEHLGDTVQDLATWARRQNLTGEVIVLIIDQPGDLVHGGFAFGTISLNA